jgi:hypothetical protein
MEAACECLNPRLPVPCSLFLDLYLDLALSYLNLGHGHHP